MAEDTSPPPSPDRGGQDAQFRSFLEGRITQHVMFGQLKGFHQLDSRAQDAWMWASTSAKTYVLLRGALIGPADSARSEYHGKSLMRARLLSRLSEFSEHHQGRPSQWCQNTSLGDHFSWPPWLDQQVLKTAQRCLPENAFLQVVQQAQQLIWSRRSDPQASSS